MDDDTKGVSGIAQGLKSDNISTDSEIILTPDHEAPSSPNNPPADSTLLDTPTMGATTPRGSMHSRNPSFSGSSSNHEDWDGLPPLDRLSVLDLLDNFALPQQLEKLQKGISAQTDKVRRSREAIKTKTQSARDRMVEEWRRRVPEADEQLDRYRKQMQRRVDKLGKRWNDTKVISVREKVSFIFGVMNIFVSGYLIGAYPEYFHLWYTAQLLYFMPIRFFTYHRRGYHYFLADLCYFTNLLLALSIWVFPGSKRLFTASYCLAFGNNAVAIIMWRNSLVFHSFDKVTSLFIHIMPCATLHCIVHLFSPDKQKERFPAIWTIKNSPPGSPTAYANVFSMLAWSSLPYLFWQVLYYIFITVRRRDKIAAGRPTSFTWLKKSYARTWLGKFVLRQPEHMQEATFMMIQYSYALLTMLPCPLWFLSRWASAGFLMVVFTWSIYNGATYYIDVFGVRFQKELEAMKAEVAQWQNSPEYMPLSPPLHPRPDASSVSRQAQQGAAPSASTGQIPSMNEVDREKDLMEGTSLSKDDVNRPVSVDKIPLLDETRSSSATGVVRNLGDTTRGRRTR
ncbi:integral membrane protein [Fusarium denticulatum]|uniref:Glycerophosphocholine acyltransferase 1 n=1 Tax=Fusarium denticulatum TaxID=48507 RepID=A0A8H5TIM3_9HYPO|nr:integral membrane protein [Fusarium denticulatum]